MPQSRRDCLIWAGVLAGWIGVLAIAVLVARAGGGAAGSSGVSDVAPVAAGTVFTITVLMPAGGQYAGDIGSIDAAGQYQSQSVAGSGSGLWTVHGRSVSVTMQNTGASGSLILTINGQNQRTDAPYGVVTLTAR